MKICVISTASLKTPPDAYGGMEKAAYLLTRGLEFLGNEVHLIAKEGSYKPAGGFSAIGDEKDIPGVVERKKQLSSIECYIDVTHDKVLGVARPDLNIIHNYQVMSLMGTGKNPVFISYGQWTGKFPEVKNAHVIYQPLDLYEMQLYDGERDNYLLYMGQKITEKRIEWACEVALKTNTPLKCFTPGWGDKAYHDLLGYYASMHPDLISFQPDIGGLKKVETIQHAKALIHPVGAKGWVEAGGIIAIEALACGTPAIVSRNGALPEYVQSGANGFVCDSIDEMVSAVGAIDSINPVACRSSVVQLDFHRIAYQWYVLCKKVAAGESW